MASFEPIDQFGPAMPPPRPTTPTVRRGFLLVLGGLSLAAGLVYGIPLMIERAGYAYESGRAKAAEEALKRLDKAGVIANASTLFRLAAARVSPAVVNIRSFRAAKPGERIDGNGPAGNGTLVPVGIGSGVVIDRQRGLIVTNQHVVKGGEQFIVRPGRGGEWPATIVGVDANTDLAVLQINAPLRVEAEWGDPDSLAVGDWVLAIGSPFNLEQSVSAGIISATGRNNLGIVGEGSYEDFLQTDAAVNPGNSGGPLIDLRGKVVGINTAIAVEGIGHGNTSSGIGLAISAGLARRVVEQIIEKGHVTRGYLGVQLRDLSDQEGRQLGIPPGRRAQIFDVEPGSAADRAGLKAGDVVLSIDGKPIHDFTELRNRTAALAPGSEIPVEFVRAGKPTIASVTIGSPPVFRNLGIRLRDGKAEDGGSTVMIDAIQFNSPRLPQRPDRAHQAARRGRDRRANPSRGRSRRPKARPQRGNPPEDRPTQRPGRDRQGRRLAGRVMGHRKRIGLMAWFYRAMHPPLAGY